MLPLLAQSNSKLKRDKLSLTKTTWKAFRVGSPWPYQGSSTFEWKMVTQGREESQEAQ